MWVLEDEFAAGRPAWEHGGGRIDPVTGAMIEPLAVAVWAVQRAQVGLRHRVLVTGAGPIGLLVTPVARAAGAAGGTVTEVNDDRLAVAAELGATRTQNTATNR